MANRERGPVQTVARQGLAIYFGTLNLAGEALSHPGRMMRNIERRGERVLTRIERNNANIRRSLTDARRSTS
ncbi:MAG: hypothetical protein WAT58_04440, partial [Candidatus Dormiibacterota bacterium]